MLDNVSKDEENGVENTGKVSTWEYEGKTINSYLACGEAAVEVNILNLNTRQPTGSFLRHIFKWDGDGAFIARESKNVTKLKRIGRSHDQEVDTVHQVTNDAEFYTAVISSGVIRKLVGNSEFDDIEKSREEMLKLAANFPEDASESIQAWLDSASFELVENDFTNNFDYLFETPDVIKVKWTLGQKENPIAMAILSFSPPKSEVRKEYEDRLQKIKSKRVGELSIAELNENFAAKLKYGANALIDVQGIDVLEPGQRFTKELKNKFIVFWNPIWFGDAVDTMQEAFSRTEGKSAKS